MNDVQFMKLLDQLLRHEGFWLRHSEDQTDKLSICVAPNQRGAVAVIPGEAVTFLERAVRRIVQQLEHRLPWFAALHSVRQRGLIDIAFALGTPSLLKQHSLLAAIQAGDWDQAATEILESHWAACMPARAGELAEMMRTGRDEILDVSQPLSA